MPTRPMPAQVTELIERFTLESDAMLRSGRALSPTAYFGKFGGPVTAMRIRTNSVASKQISAQKIRQAASKVNADYVLVVMEAWGLPPEHVKNYQSILRDYGSIAECPFKTNLFVITVETHQGSWSGSTSIVRSNSRFGLTLDHPPEMLFVDRIEGILAMLLIPR